MKIDIKGIHCDVPAKVRDYAAEKIGRFEKYYKNIISAEIAFDCEESFAKASKRYGLNVKIVIPGKDLFAEGTAQDMISVVDVVEKKLRAQILRLTDGQKSNKLHRARRFLKEFFGR